MNEIVFQCQLLVMFSWKFVWETIDHKPQARSSYSAAQGQRGTPHANIEKGG